MLDQRTEHEQCPQADQRVVVAAELPRQIAALGQGQAQLVGDQPQGLDARRLGQLRSKTRPLSCAQTIADLPPSLTRGLRPGR